VVEGQVLTHTQTLEAGAPVSSSRLEVEVVRDLKQFDAMAPEWETLLNRWSTGSVFLSHAWFRSWWEMFGNEQELHLITVRAGGELLAVAPMMRTRASIYGFKADALHAIYNPHTPRYDFIVAKNPDARVYEAIWAELVAHSDCELIVLAQIPAESQTLSSMETLARRDGWRTGQWIAPASPYIRLGCDYDSFFNGLSDSCRFNLNKRYARLQRHGPVDVEIVTERDRIDEAMRDGLRIEAAAWKGARGTAMLSDPAVAEFYIRFAKREADLGELRLTFLRLGGKRIAFNYLLESRSKLYAVKIGYDPEYHAYSPGNMLLNLLLRDACGKGIEEYDLLGGDDEWKFEWTKETREHRWLFLFRNRLRPRLLHWFKFGMVAGVKAGCYR
jgi:CelD/BcsL family acetyltransferase involved in cellulose biosynthesis